VKKRNCLSQLSDEKKSTKGKVKKKLKKEICGRTTITEDAGARQRKRWEGARGVLFTVVMPELLKKLSRRVEVTEEDESNLKGGRWENFSKKKTFV